MGMGYSSLGVARLRGCSRTQNSIWENGENKGNRARFVPSSSSLHRFVFIFVFVPSSSSSSSSSSRDLRLHRHPLIFVFIPSSKSKTETRPSSTRNREIPCFPLLQSSYTLSWKILISFHTHLEDLAAQSSGRFWLRIVHRDFSDLIEHTGFGWDPVANTVTASEDVWASYLKKSLVSQKRSNFARKAERFQRSKDTIHRQFKRVLGALCALAPRIIRPQSRGETPSQILNNPKYYPYFEKCIGAIDGTHVVAWAPAQKQTSYRGRKILITQNVMCACSFDMMFTFVYTGWEGTANDSRVFIDAVMRPENEFPFPDEGYYYVVDAGYSNVPGFLAPY
ncbi:unnamed protein product [Prunus armeniaca]